MNSLIKQKQAFQLAAMNPGAALFPNMLLVIGNDMLECCCKYCCFYPSRGQGLSLPSRSSFTRPLAFSSILEPVRKSTPWTNCLAERELDPLSLAKFVRKARKKIMPAMRHTPDNPWEGFKLVSPPGKPAGTIGGRLCHSEVLDGILHVLTGCLWKKVSKESGPGSTCHARFQEWVSIGSLIS